MAPEEILRGIASEGDPQRGMETTLSHADHPDEEDQRAEKAEAARKRAAATWLSTQFPPPQQREEEGEFKEWFEQDEEASQAVATAAAAREAADEWRSYCEAARDEQQRAMEEDLRWRKKLESGRAAAEARAEDDRHREQWAREARLSLASLDSNFICLFGPTPSTSTSLAPNT